MSSNIICWEPLRLEIKHDDILFGEDENLVPYAVKPFFKQYKEGELALEILRQSPVKDPVGERKILGSISPQTKRLATERAELEQECYKIYLKACSQDMPFVLGAEELRSSKGIPEMKNFGVLCCEKPACPRAVLESGVDVHTGAILCDSSWSVFKNDWAMLGVIHAGRTCYVSNISKKELDDDLWDEDNKRPKVLGREIVMLHQAGYKQVVEDRMIERFGHMFMIEDKSKLSLISYSDLVKATKLVTSKNEILELLKKVE